MLRISLCQNGNYLVHRNILRYPVPFITMSSLHSSLRLKEIYEVDPRASEYLNLYLLLLHPLKTVEKKNKPTHFPPKRTSKFCSFCHFLFLHP